MWDPVPASCRSRRGSRGPPKLTNTCANAWSGRCANGLQGSVLELELPEPVDVVVAEMIETGLLDELHIPSINRLFDRGIVNSRTRFLPESYHTSVQLVSIGRDLSATASCASPRVAFLRRRHDRMGGGLRTLATDVETR
jgi:hypothetical protein